MDSNNCFRKCMLNPRCTDAYCGFVKTPVCSGVSLFVFLSLSPLMIWNVRVHTCEDWHNLGEFCVQRLMQFKPKMSRFSSAWRWDEKLIVILVSRSMPISLKLGFPGLIPIQHVGNIYLSLKIFLLKRKVHPIRSYMITPLRVYINTGHDLCCSVLVVSFDLSKGVGALAVFSLVCKIVDTRAIRNYKTVAHTFSVRHLLECNMPIAHKSSHQRYLFYRLPWLSGT